jgi:radical SAM superfamily enzyme YgiQ (UPF0313 family)
MGSFFKNKKNSQPTTEELVERGFAPKNGKIDILFIYPPSTVADRLGVEDMGEIGGDTIPLGIASLAAYLREKNFGVGVLDCTALRLNIDQINEIIKKKDPAIIGFSVTTYGLSTAIDLAKKIRQTFPTKLTLCGGAHARDAPEETNYDFFDIVTYGKDGEIIIHDIVKKYSAKNFNRNSFLQDFEDLESIKGIVYRKNNIPIQTSPSEVIKNLDELPFPARDLMPMERYVPFPNAYKRLPATNMVLIRGCPYFCSFCSEASTGARRRSPEKAIAEMKHCIEEHGIKEIHFWDDTLSYHRKWMKDFLNKLIKENLDITWTCFAAVNTVDKEILQLMAKSGCWRIFYGYETAVPALAKNLLTDKKNRDLDNMKKIAQLTREAGIDANGSFMIGLPGETPELAKQTIQNTIDLDPDTAQFSIATPYPGTQLYKEIKEGKWGKFLTEDLKNFSGSAAATWLPFGYSSPEELKKMQSYAFRRFYLRPKYIFKQILKIRSFQDIKKYFIGAKALVKGYLIPNM